MYNITKICRIFTLAIFTLITLDKPLWASDPDMNPKLITPAGPDQQIEHYQSCLVTLGYAYAMKEYESVLELNEELPVHNEMLPGWDLLTFEAGLRHRHCFVTNAYYVLSEKFKTKPVRQRQYLESGIKSLEPYFTYIKTAPTLDQLPAEIRNTVTFLRQDVFTAMAVFKSSLYELAKRDEKLQFCKDTILSCKESIKYIELVAKIASPLKVEAQQKIPAEKFNLMQLYCNLTSFTLDEGHLREARALRDELRTLDQVLFEKAKRIINVTNDDLLASRKAAQKLIRKTVQQKTNKKGKPSSRHAPSLSKGEKLMQAKINGQLKEADRGRYELSNEIRSMTYQKSFVTEIQDLYTEVRSLDFNSPDVWEKVVARLYEIEVRIYASLELQGPMDEDNLQKIYGCLVELLPPDMWLKSLPERLVALTRVDNLDGAILRLRIVKNMQEAKFGQVTRLTSMYYAYLQTFNGEYIDWLAFEGDLTEEQQREEEAKAAKQVAAREKYVAELKAAQAASLVKPEVRNTNTTRPTSVTAPLRDDKGKYEADDDKGAAAYTYDGGPKVDPVKEKQEKRERHLINEQQRQVHHTQDPVPHVPAAVSRSRPEPVLVPVDNNSEEITHSLILLYGLTGIARDVELRILRDDWDITKDELLAYFGSMGCVCKPGGRGSHSKIKLNSSLHVEKDGEIMTILVEAGGALTVPAWEDYMKHYLRKQVLKARKDLMLGAILAKKGLEEPDKGEKG